MHVLLLSSLCPLIKSAVGYFLDATLVLLAPPSSPSSLCAIRQCGLCWTISYSVPLEICSLQPMEVGVAATTATWGLCSTHQAVLNTPVVQSTPGQQFNFQALAMSTHKLRARRAWPPRVAPRANALVRPINSSVWLVLRAAVRCFDNLSTRWLMCVCLQACKTNWLKIFMKTRCWNSPPTRTAHVPHSHCRHHVRRL